MIIEMKNMKPQIGEVLPGSQGHGASIAETLIGEHRGGESSVVLLANFN